MKDYKAHYLKYKFKYLKAQSQKSNNNKFKGGDIINNQYILGLSVAALFAGAIYYIYTEQTSKAIEYTDELKNQEDLLNEFEKAHLKELETITQEDLEKHSLDELFPNKNDKNKFEEMMNIKPAMAMSEDEKEKMNIETETLNEMIKVDKSTDDNGKDGKPEA